MKNMIKNIVCVVMIAIGGWYMTVMSQKDIETPEELMTMSMPMPPSLQDAPMISEETVVEQMQPEPSVSMPEMPSGYGMPEMPDMPTMPDTQDQPEQAEQPFVGETVEEVPFTPDMQEPLPSVPAEQEPVALPNDDVDMLIDQIADKLVGQRVDMIKESIKQKLHDAINEALGK